MAEELNQQAFRRPDYRCQETAKNTSPVLKVSQARSRDGRTGEKLTFPRILVVRTMAHGVPSPDLTVAQLCSFEFRTLPVGTVSIEFDLRDYEMRE
jgi:hypothetical protein